MKDDYSLSCQKYMVFVSGFIVVIQIFMKLNSYLLLSIASAFSTLALLLSKSQYVPEDLWLECLGEQGLNLQFSSVYH